MRTIIFLTLIVLFVSQCQAKNCTMVRTNSTKPDSAGKFNWKPWKYLTDKECPFMEECYIKDKLVAESNDTCTDKTKYVVAGDTLKLECKGECKLYGVYLGLLITGVVGLVAMILYFVCRNRDGYGLV